MRTSLVAVGHWFNASENDLEEPESAGAAQSARSSSWREALSGAAISQPALFDLLRDAGVPMTACHAVASAEEAVEWAEEFGFPVVLKGCKPKLAHKSELGLVRLPLHDSPSIREAFSGIGEVLRRQGGGEIVVQPMTGEGVELIVGLRCDPAFGVVVMVGLGGVLVEFIKSVSIRLGAVDHASALTMLEECRAAEPLRGLRGKGPFDLAAAARAITALSHFGVAVAGAFSSVEINPLIVGKGGAVGVDALLTLADPVR